jgi:uncharacterized protein (TIGR03437 family)
LDAAGFVPQTLEATEVLFDGRPSPILLTSTFQLNVQVPYEVSGQADTELQVRYRGVPSNRIRIGVVKAAPELYARLGILGDAAAINEDGSVNGPSNPAARGSILTLFASGTGITAPAIATGAAAQAPYPAPAIALTLTLAGQPAETVFAGAAPGLVGVLQVNARVPADAAIAPVIRRAAVILKVGEESSRTGVAVWLQ